jgi:hypothetical protein
LHKYVPVGKNGKGMAKRYCIFIKVPMLPEKPAMISGEEPV